MIILRHTLSGDTRLQEKHIVLKTVDLRLLAVPLWIDLDGRASEQIWIGDRTK